MRPSKLVTLLKRIAGLSQKHTALFMAEEWDQMDTVRQKIIRGWNEYTLTADGMRTGHKCFYCGKVSDGIQYLIAGKPDEPEYFCSAECSRQFGILKGTT